MHRSANSHPRSALGPWLIPTAMPNVGSDGQGENYYRWVKMGGERRRITGGISRGDRVQQIVEVENYIIFDIMTINQIVWYGHDC